MAIRTSCFMMEDKSSGTFVRWNDVSQELIIVRGTIMTIIRVLGLPTSHLMLPEVYDAKNWPDMGAGTRIYDCTGKVVAVHSRCGGIKVKVGERMIMFPLSPDSDFRTMSGTCDI